MVSVSSSLGVDQHQDTEGLVSSLLSSAEVELIDQALEIARLRGDGYYLDTGESTFDHALGVGRLLAELRADAPTRLTGLLAPLVFFDKQIESRMEAQFGKDIGRMLASLRKLFKMKTLVGPSVSAETIESLRWAEQIETLRKMLLAMSTDIRVVLIRLCSRLQTLRHFSANKPVKDKESNVLPYAMAHAQETIDLYAPLANRLGLWQLKWELEDLSFRILDPRTYKRIAKMLDEKRTEREAFIGQAIQTIKGHLTDQGISGEITGRPKHIYSIWNKMLNKGVPFEHLNDVRACRIIVQDIETCYRTLGVIHNLFSVVPEEFDDYIVNPKPNGYQSLHTVVEAAPGKNLEVQIRTPEMHQFAEYGVAAHWRYKEAGKEGYEGESRAEGAFEERIALLRQLLAWQKEVTDTMGNQDDWATQMRTSALNDHVYVFTPQAKVIELPQNATPLDFAYHVHTELGHRCRGAKVNGQLLPLNTALENGQTVEIITARADAQATPSRDWLNPSAKFLVSHRAKQKVKQWFAREERHEMLDRGRTMAEKELQRIGETSQKLELLAQKMGFDKTDDLYSALAREEIRPRSIETALTPPKPEKAGQKDEAKHLKLLRKPSKDKDSGVLVVGVSALMTNLARCCRPAPPDPIIGFVTRGKGISIHRVGCSNLTEVMRTQPERLIETSWGDSAGLHYPVDIIVTSNDRHGLLRDVTEVFSKEKVNMTNVQTDSHRGVARMYFTLEVTTGEALTQVLSKLLEVDAVFEARRR